MPSSKGEHTPERSEGVRFFAALRMTLWCLPLNLSLLLRLLQKRSVDTPQRAKMSVTLITPRGALRRSPLGLLLHVLFSLDIQ